MYLNELRQPAGPPLSGPAVTCKIGGMSQRTGLCALAAISFLAALSLTACSGTEATKAAKLSSEATSPAEPATPTLAAPAPATATTAPPAPTPPPTASPPPAGGLQFKPAQIAQGGFAIVYLNEAASSATATFQTRQYPMLHDGSRWWTIIGLGAFTQSGLHPVTVLYTPTGRTQSTSVVASIAVTAREFPVEYIELSQETAALLAPEIVQAELAQRAAIYSGYTAQRLWSGPFVPPSKSATSGIYGEGRSYNGAPVTDYHRGTDFVGQIGSPVAAAAAGRVVFTGELRVRGGTVMIDHGVGVFTAYHHLSSVAVAEGQAVAAGQVIGAVGSTGVVTGPHLHWEVIVRGVEVDGQLWLTAEEVKP